eukprot:gene14487-5549_t
MDSRGIILHAKSSSDFLTLELVGGKLRYAADFGKTYDSYGEVSSGFHELFVGQGLADNEWHNVVLIHNEEKQKVYISIDNLKESEYNATRTLAPGTAKFTIEYIHIGGMKFHDTISVKESLTRRGLKACFTNSSINDRSVLDGDHVTLVKAVRGSCPFVRHFNSVDFPMNGSYVSYNFTSSEMSVEFSFRTILTNQKLFYTSQKSALSQFIDVDIDAEGKVTMTYGNFALKSSSLGLNDGFWHEVKLSFSSSLMLELTVDRQVASVRAKQALKIKDKVFFGPNYAGCMKNIMVNGKKLVISDFDKYEAKSVANLKGSLRPTFGRCSLNELCVPNPCLHGGKCQQKTEVLFSCNCANTGYSGSVCNKPGFGRSCAALKAHAKGTVTSGMTQIDVDGAGPLPATTVECIYDHNKVTTNVYPKIASDLAVENRFGMKSIFVPYNADLRSLVSITQESLECQQHVKFVCTKSSLYDSPNGQPKVRWLGPKNYFHYYWGGSKGKTNHCRCGIYNNCTDTSKYCNCDARSEKEATDEGFLTNKKHLPMKKIEFLDVNSNAGSKGRFSLGPLSCSGDASTDNAVSFRDAMAFLQVKPISATDYNNAIDALTVSFNFKTVKAEGIMFYGKGRTSNDYIMVQIASKKRLRGEINLGSQADFVDIDISGNFDDNKAHSVFLEFNRKELKLTVDGITKSVQRNPLSMSHLDLAGDPMYLGGGFDVSQGFTGCIFGLFLNGMMIDIKATAKYLQNYGVHAGCGIGCNRLSAAPCNYGKCIERYTSFQCDCSLSPFDGKFCHKESYPLHFKNGSSLMYTFVKPVQIMEGEAVLAFKTTSSDALLFSIHGDKPNCHLSLVLKDGSLEVSFNFDTTSSSSKVIKVHSTTEKGRFDDGKIHNVRVFHNAKKVTVEVLDRISEKRKEVASTNGDLLDGVKISIGRIKPPLPSTLGSVKTFIGCMSAFKYRYLANMASKPVLVDVFALYGKMDPSIGGSAFPGACGKALPTPKPLPYLFGRPTQSTATLRPFPRFYKVERDLSPIIIGVACGFAFLLLVILILFCKHINRNIGAYKTNEDRRPLSTDAETTFTPPPDSMDGPNGQDNAAKSSAKGTKKQEYYV